ncbi:MAG: aminomethyl transferase family protein [Desulfofustis sp.]|nr:aminomethyl transferase family protein [Desulfofustis sp.]
MTSKVTQPARTVLYDWHLAQHAAMAEFGGYQMPLWYPTGAKHEHRTVLTGAGLFDTSHMAVLTVTGDDARSLLQHCFTRDLRSCIGVPPGPLKTGRCVYGLFLKENGTVLDDAIISQLTDARFMVVVNSGMGPVVGEHLRAQSGFGAEIIDYSGRIGKIDLQGPAAARVLETVLAEPDQVLSDMIYFSCKGDIGPAGAAPVMLKDGTPVLVSRTGYTGEFGFELYLAAADTVAVWEALHTAGARFAITACGLAARDSLRTGAVLPLSHQDIGDWLFQHTPWSFVLPWNEQSGQFSKSFIGAEALLGDSEASYTCAFAGYDPRKIPVTADTVVLADGDEAIGRVLTCTTDMAIDRVGERIISMATPESAGRPPDFQPRGLSCGFIRTTRRCRIGEQVRLTDGKRSIPVEIRQDIRPDRTARRPMREMRNQ